MAAGENGSVEIYGESAARPVFSADFDLPPDRAVALAISELRLEPDQAPLSLGSLLPVPRTNPVANDLSQRALPYAAALCGSLPVAGLGGQPAAAGATPVQLARHVHPKHRAGSAAASCGWRVWSRNLRSKTGATSRRSKPRSRSIEPQAKRSAVLDREMLRAQARSRVLDEFRSRTKADLDSLNELTALLKPPTWTNMIDLAPGAATITGETDQAAPLLKLLDASPYFQNSTFVGSIAKSGGNEQFQIRTARRARP